jgi:hypothetical protein
MRTAMPFSRYSRSPRNAFRRLLLQRLVGGGNHAHVDLDRLAAADTLEHLVLQEAQQLGLQRDRHLADLVQEQGAARPARCGPAPGARRR